MRFRLIEMSRYRHSAALLVFSLLIVGCGKNPDKLRESAASKIEKDRDETIAKMSAVNEKNLPEIDKARKQSPGEAKRLYNNAMGDLKAEVMSCSDRLKRIQDAFNKDVEDKAERKKVEKLIKEASDVVHAHRRKLEGQLYEARTKKD